MTRQELSQIYYLNKEIRMWQNERNNIQLDSINTPSLSGLPHKPGVSDRVGKTAADIADIDATIERLLRRVQEERRRIIEYIESIEDSYVRQIMFYRHVSCMSWARVAANIGGGNTGDGVKQAHSRFLRKK